MITVGSASKPSKVLLVNYAGYTLTANTFVPDSSLATLAAVLQQHGIPVEIVDLQNPYDIGTVMDEADPGAAAEVLHRLANGLPIDRPAFDAYRLEREAGQRRFEERVTRELIERIGRDDVGLVGFKLWAGNGLTGSVTMAEAIRRAHPNVTLVAGGPAVSYARDRLLARAPVFDAVVYGDGEQAIVALARGRWDAPGTVHRDAHGLRPVPPAYERDLDAVPMPVYSPDVYPGIDRMFRMRILDDSRGCFNKCSFCSHTHLSGITRTKSPERVVDEMERGVDEGVRYFRLAGSNPPRKFLESVAREILRRGLDVCYGAYGSMNNVRPSLMPMFAESGLRGLFFGIESGDPVQLKRAHNKNNIGRDHVVQVGEAAMREGIFTCVSLIVPAPFETAATREATLSLVRAMFARHQHGSVVVLPAFLTPGSDWWARPEAFGFRLQPGFDEESLLFHLLHWDPNFLLPRELAENAGYTLDGRSCAQMFEQCQQFMTVVEDEGIPTNVDDASFMIGLMAGMDVRSYKAEMLSRLVTGGSAGLTTMVARMNAAAETTRWPVVRDHSEAPPVRVTPSRLTSPVHEPSTSST